MTEKERAVAEKALMQFKDYIEIKDFGLALIVMHKQLTRQAPINTTTELKTSILENLKDRKAEFIITDNKDGTEMMSVNSHNLSSMELLGFCDYLRTKTMREVLDSTKEIEA